MEFYRPVCNAGKNTLIIAEMEKQWLSLKSTLNFKVSTGLAERYKCLNARITTATPEQLAIIDWHAVRQCYAVLSALVKKVDTEISGIILLSFGNNIYFICLQLLNGLS